MATYTPQVEILLYNYFKMFDINLNVVSKRTKPMDKDLMIEGIISQIKMIFQCR